MAAVKVKYVCLNCAHVQSVKSPSPECTQCRSRRLVPYDKEKIIQEHLHLVNLAARLQYLVEHPDHKGPYSVGTTQKDLKDLILRLGLVVNEHLKKHEQPPSDVEAMDLYRKLLALYYSCFTLEVCEMFRELLDSNELPEPVRALWKDSYSKGGCQQ